MEDVQENQPITLDLKPKEPQPQDLNFQTVWVETVPKFKITSVAFHSTQSISFSHIDLTSRNQQSVRWYIRWYYLSLSVQVT